MEVDGARRRRPFGLARSLSVYLHSFRHRGTDGSQSHHWRGSGSESSVPAGDRFLQAGGTNRPGRLAESATRDWRGIAALLMGIGLLLEDARAVCAGLGHGRRDCRPGDGQSREAQAAGRGAGEAPWRSANGGSGRWHSGTGETGAGRIRSDLRRFPSTAGRMAFRTAPSQHVAQFKPAPGIR